MNRNLLRANSVVRLLLRHLFSGLLALILILSPALLAHRSNAESQTGKPLGREDRPTPANAIGSAQGDLYALVVGVSKYRHPKITDLKLSAQDAKSFAEFLKTQTKLFKDIHVTVLVNDQATKAEIERNLYYELRKVGKDDTVILFFSGHGTDDPFIPGEFYFVASDSVPENLQGTAVRMTGLRFLKLLEAKRLLLIADACHAGGFSPDASKALAPSLNKFMGEFLDSSGRVIITSSKPDEYSLELPQLNNAVFTHCLLQGLKGEADRNLDGIVTVREAYDYVYAHTKDLTSGAQHPQFEGRVVGAFPVSFLGRTAAQLELGTSPSFVDVFLKDKSTFRFVKKSDAQGRVLLRDLPFEQPIIVKLSKPGWKDLILNPFILSKDKPYRKGPDVKLEPALGFLVLRTNCPKASVKMNDKSIGETAGDGMLILDGVQVGVPHSFTLVKKGFHDKKVAITIPVSHEGTVYKAPMIRLRRRATEVSDSKATRAVTRDGPDAASRPAGRAERMAREKRQEQLFMAVRAGDSNSVRRLLSEGTDINAPDRRGWTALMYAAANNRIDIANIFMASGGDVNARDNVGWTPLMVAVGNGHPQMVELLLKHGANREARDLYGQTAAMKAALAGHKAILRLFQESSDTSVPTIGSGEEPKVEISPALREDLEKFLDAAKRGDRKEVTEFLARGMDVDARDQLGWTALMYACAENHVEVAKLLLSKGAAVNGRNKLGWAPLMIAASNGHADVVRLLLRKGADRGARNIYGETAALKASLGKHKDVLRLLKVPAARTTESRPSRKAPTEKPDKSAFEYGTMSDLKIEEVKPHEPQGPIWDREPMQLHAPNYSPTCSVDR